MASKKKYAGFRIDEDLLQGLRDIRERDGITVPEQVRRAIREWLERRHLVRGGPKRTPGRISKTESVRAATRGKADRTPK